MGKKVTVITVTLSVTNSQSTSFHLKGLYNYESVSTVISKQLVSSAYRANNLTTPKFSSLIRETTVNMHVLSGWNLIWRL